MNVFNFCQKVLHLFPWYIVFIKFIIFQFFQMFKYIWNMYWSTFLLHILNHIFYFFNKFFWIFCYIIMLTLFRLMLIIYDIPYCFSWSWKIITQSIINIPKFLRFIFYFIKTLKNIFFFIFINICTLWSIFRYFPILINF